MKKLLIHSNNTSFSNTAIFQLSEQFVFDVDFDKDVDVYINDNLTAGNLKQKLENCDVIFIKASLSNNYLEYLGLRLAYHIRLTKILGHKANLPIIIVAEESFQYLGLTYTEPSILFTQGIYLIKESLEDYLKTTNWFNGGRINPLDDISNFVSSVSIKPPANYISHHSIANEWSILRWAKILGISDEKEALKDVKTNIESLLYYKFLLAKHPVETEPDMAAFKINGKGSILYIDDEWSKGWDLVFEKFFAPSSDISFECLKYDFKDKPQDVIIKECKNVIESSKPDLVLLDLRLSDSDFTNSHKSELLTGYKVLKAVKLINPGIQVIIFTASNKVWNLMQLQANGADGFLLKESPELTIHSSHTSESLSSLSKQISLCLSNAYLKEVWEILEGIRRQFSANPLAQYYPNDFRCLRGIQYQNLLLLELHSMYNILNSEDENRFSYAMLIQFKILECIVEIFIPEKARDGNWLFYDGSKVKYYYSDDDKIHERTESLHFFDRNAGKKASVKIPAYEYNSTRNKIDCLVEQKLIVENKLHVHKMLKNLVNYRNGFIHPTDRLNLKPLSSENIIEWITIIGQILKKI
jgi:CheY-like chemotaxis protein